MSVKERILNSAFLMTFKILFLLHLALGIRNRLYAQINKFSSKFSSSSWWRVNEKKTFHFKFWRKKPPMHTILWSELITSPARSRREPWCRLSQRLQTVSPGFYEDIYFCSSSTFLLCHPFFKDNITDFSLLCMLVGVWQHSVDLLQYFEFWWGGSVSTSGIEGEVSQFNIYIASLHRIHKLLATEYGILDPKSFEAEGQNRKMFSYCYCYMYSCVVL